jgi:adenosylmethionine---8-amino-7-oxononanoate aminotransferase
MSPVWYPFDVYDNCPQPDLVGAKGAWLFAADGRRYFDAISSWWVNIHGHCHPILVHALQEQAAAYDQVMFSGFTHAPARCLAERLCYKAPGQAHAFFSDNGSTAVEVALKLALHAQQHSGRPLATQIVALQGAYHGDTIGTMAAGQQGLFTKPYQPFLYPSHHLPVFPVTNLDADLSESELLALEQVDALFASQTIAALIVEPLVQGAGGMRFISKAYLNALYLLARKNKIFIIADEVMTAFGRTGTLFASEQLSTPPDFICLSKGLTGGSIALGLTLCSAAVYDLFQNRAVADRFLHGHSFSANPIACAVALASLSLYENVEQTSDRNTFYVNLQKLRAEFEEKEGIKMLRCVGGIFAFEVQTNERNGFLNPVRNQFYKQSLEAGFLIRPLGNTIYLMPPYCTTVHELEAVGKHLSKLIESYTSLSKQVVTG